MAELAATVHQNELLPESSMGRTRLEAAQAADAALHQTAGGLHPTTRTRT